MLTLPDNLTSGFGTVLAAEHDFLAQLHTLLVSTDKRLAPNVDRVLEQHACQVASIIELLEEREGLLPHPTRFDVLKEAPRPKTSSSGNLSVNVREPLARLVKTNQTLLRNISTLIGQSGHLDSDEARLREVARLHEDMDYTLAAVIHPATVDRSSPVPTRR